MGAQDAVYGIGRIAWLAINANLRFKHLSADSGNATEWGVGLGASGTALKSTNWVWLVSGGGLRMFGR